MQKRISELTPEQQEEKRKYNRETKRRSRANQKVGQTPSAEEWFENWPTSFPEQAEQLREHVKGVQRKVRQELKWPDSTFETYGWSREKYADTFPLGHTPEADAVHQAACTLFCLKKNQHPFVREVHSPSGVRVGGLYFPDVLGSDLVYATHRYGLNRSQTFATTYRELLQILDQRFGKHLSEDPVERRAAMDIKAELAGEYVPPPSAEQNGAACAVIATLPVLTKFDCCKTFVKASNHAELYPCGSADIYRDKGNYDSKARID